MTRPSTLKPFLQLAARITSTGSMESGRPVQDVIRGLLERKDAGLRGDDRFRLLRAVNMSAIGDASLSQVLTALHAVCDATRPCPYIAPLTETEAWVKALSLAAGNAIYQEMGRLSLQRFSRDHAVVGALQRLAQRSYVFEFNEGGVLLETKMLARLCTRLDKLVRGLGGRGVVKRVIHEYAQTNRMLDGSFLYGRMVTQVPQARLPSIPWHYLFQLGMKHLRQGASARNPEQDWRMLVELARDLCAAINVEPYSSFEMLDVAPLGLQDVLQDLVLYDEMFSFQQWQPKYAGDLIEAWLSSMARQGFKVPGLARDQSVALTRSLLSCAHSDGFATTSSAGHASADLAAAEIEQVFKLMTSGSARPNAEYLTPLDTAKRSAPYIPLFKLGADSYLLPPRALVARALFEQCFKRLRDAAPPSPKKAMDKYVENLGAAMGKSLEDLALSALTRTEQQRIISCAAYLDPSSKKKLEVDLLVETEERVFLIECKKKALTNLARGGNPLNAIIDLSAALLDMAVQLARHERVLRSTGEVAFMDGSKVMLNGRDIEKIAVTMLDHGSLQDRVLLGGLIRGLFGAQLKTSSTRHDTLLAPVNKTLATLQTELTSIAGAGFGGDINKAVHSFGMSTWWLGIDTLTYLCRENPDLWSALKPLRHLTFRTGDIMTEMHYVKQRSKDVPGGLPKNIGHVLVDPGKRG